MFNKNEEKKSVVDMANSSNVISKETRITGDIQAQGNIRIEGTVDGMIQSKSKIAVGESALVKGNLTAVEAEIAGKVEGEVICSDTLYLKSTALIIGNIFTKKLVVENGAVFNGKCQMNSQNTMVASKPEVNGGSAKKELASG